MNDKPVSHVVGLYPSHVHTDQDGQEWSCNSPYCDEIKNVNPPEKGGPPIVHKGQEPWKGR